MSRRARLVLLVLLTPILLVVLTYVGFGIAGMVRVHHAKERARNDVRTHLRAAEDLAVVQAKAARREAHRGEPTHTSHRLECDLTTQDAGWIVQDYVQECRIHTMDSYSRPPGLLETYTPVSRTSVGCGAWPTLFCMRPYDDPALPEGVR